jgi:mono/diheme cytochrome c family protein
VYLQASESDLYAAHPGCGLYDDGLGDCRRGRYLGAELERGKDEYHRSCEPCHGATGKGDGPNAKHLAKRPADLTKLSESYGGVFPFERVFETIDGRLDVALHGPREMPVWGDRYKRDVLTTVPTNSVSDEMANIMARNRILQLIEYLSTLQGK